MTFASVIAFDLPPMLAENLGWIIAGLIIVVGLLGFGFKDLLRFRPRRVWAISSVSWAESIRRRILWITPLAIFGVIIVAQLQKPIDEQDAIRQTTKFCLLATGLVVTITTIILACTNLPREIDNRVIYTVVTKPTTRLEIVLGKILGFARVSAAILCIMGLFTWGYLHLRALSLEHGISEKLKDPAYADSVSRPTMQHYVDAGLLNAKTLATPTHMNIFARVPEDGNTRRYFNNEGDALIPFKLPDNTVAAADPSGKQYTGPGMILRVRVGYEPTAATAAKPTESATSRPFTGPSPLVSSTQPAAGSQTSGPPQVQVQIFDVNHYSLMSQEINNGKPITLDSPDGQWISINLASPQVALLAKQPYFYVSLLPTAGNVTYWVDDSAAELVVPVLDKAEPVVIAPLGPKEFLGRQGSYGQQIKGSADQNGAVCIYEFKDVDVSTSAGAKVPIELRIGIERGGDEPADADAPTLLAMQVRNHKSGQTIDAGILRPENNRTAFATVPATAFDGGNFDVIVRCLSPEHWVGLTPTSLAIVQSETQFGVNLFKSLFIIWLLAVLVISISIFCSTFLSWPIAVVLTLVILLGRWGVEQLGDAASAGLGRQFVQDFGVRDPAQAQALSSTVEQLNKMLTLIATVLPDISRFSATEDIERGISIPAHKIGEALTVLLGFGLPLSVLAYVFLKNKEVAP